MYASPSIDINRLMFILCCVYFQTNHPNGQLTNDRYYYIYLWNIYFESIAVSWTFTYYTLPARQGLKSIYLSPSFFRFIICDDIMCLVDTSSAAVSRACLSSRNISTHFQRHEFTLHETNRIDMYTISDVHVVF